MNSLPHNASCIISPIARRKIRPISKLCAKFILLLLLIAPTPGLSEDISDPLEGLNRGIFYFNNTLDKYLLAPIAKGYTKVTPNPVRSSIRNFFSNIKYPVYLLSDLTQGKLCQAGTHTGRFLINSTVGVAGLFDAASKAGLEHHEEDFGASLGYLGVGPGPYIVLPILGPSSLRDVGGLVVDSVAHPLRWASFGGSLSNDEDIGLTALGIVEIVETRASLQQAIEAAQEASLDYYSFVRTSYQQRRQALIYDGMPPEEEFDDFDDEFEE